MSEGMQPAASGKDPVVRFLIGCALVAAAFLVIVIGCVTFIGWRLTRDETPGRAEEVFLTGDETRYWCVELKPDDAGLAALVEHIDRSAEEAREDALQNSPLKNFPFVRRRNQLAQLFPLKGELALAEGGWSSRATFSKGVWKVRAATKLVRWIAGRDRDDVVRFDADGVQVTSIRGRRTGKSFALTMVGNRLLVANGAERLKRALAIGAGGMPIDPRIPPLHDAVRQAGEDGWAFAPGPTVASFDVNARDELAFRILAKSDAPMDAPAALTVVKGLLPYLADDALHLDEGSPRLREDGLFLIEGRVDAIARRLSTALFRFSASAAEKATEKQSPSATPSPPSPRP